MDSKQLMNRTQKFALNVIKFTEQIPRTRSGEVLAKQLLRSACSIGANYRAACRAQSYSHFISKISIVEEESDESLYWLELMTNSGIIDGQNIKPLIKEADELTAIFTAVKKTSRSNRLRDKSKI